MFVLAQSGASAVDLTGLDIRVNTHEDENGQIVTDSLSVIGYGFGYEVLLGQYALEEQARAIFNDILVKMKNGRDFYDVQEEERKFVDNKG